MATPRAPRADVSRLDLDRRTLLRSLALGAGGLGAALFGHAGDVLAFGQAPAPAIPASPADLKRGPIVTLESGRVRGYVDNGIHAFKGIPYGADTAARRFQAPEPVAPWTGVRDAIAFGDSAPQGGRGGGWFPADEAAEQSENCLNLNVWTPGVGDSGKRPVMVWFHPGGYSGMTSNTSIYDGVRLCRRGDVVVVTVNHRLNALGFLYLAEVGGEAFADSGNAGMLDLILALQWVKTNIAQFGGDPGRVLIFGESGGGAKCATLMAMPAARGLFHRVATHSGQQITGSRKSTGTAGAQAFLAALQVTPDRIHELKTLPLSRIKEATRAVRSFAPVVDGRHLPRDPFEPDAPPLSRDIPMILGNNHDETRILIGGGDPGTFALTWETLPARLDAVKQFMGDLDRGAVIAEYRKNYPAYNASDVFFAVTTAARSWRGQVIEADRRAAQPAGAAPTYVFQLNWASPVDGGKWKAPHGLDIPLVFDNVALAPQMVGDGVAAQVVADAMSTAWIAFARSGDPNHAGLARWAPYTVPRRAVMVFDTVSRLEDDPRGFERRIFEKVPYLQPGT